MDNGDSIKEALIMGDPNIAGYEYALMIFTFVTVLMTVRVQFSAKYDARFFDKEIPKNSFWRKLYPFKEKENNPLVYCKFVPFIISVIIFIAVLIIYVIYWISPELLRPFLVSKGVVISALCYPMVVALYMLIMIY